MKKILLSVLCTMMALATMGLSGCANSNVDETTTNDTEPERLSIVTTTFPEYDWMKQVLGDRVDDVDLTLLADSGVDLHSFQPTVDDFAAITKSDVFVYGGGESEQWAAQALQSNTNPDQVVVNLLDSLGDSVKAEETVEGMEPEAEEHDHADDATEDTHGEESDAETDEHVWLSLDNAKVLTQVFAEALSESDPDNAQTYAANAAAYGDKLAALSNEYAALVENAPRRTILVADRFPFRYLVDDYGLDYYAAFPGCSAETEASFETMRFLAQKVDELNLPAILIIDGGDGKIAETVRENTSTKDQQVLVLDSMQSIDAAEVEAGANYLDIMKSNLDVLSQALS